MRLSSPQLAVVAALALFVSACAQPTAVPPPTTLPEPTAVPATEAVATESTVPNEPTVDSAMVEPMPDDGAPDAGPVPEGGAEPAVQFIAMTDLNDLQVGREAQVGVLTADSDGLERVDLQVDGQVVATLPTNRETEFQGVLAWTPEAAGEHNAVLIAYDAKGLPGQAEQRTVMVRAAEPPTAAATAPAAATRVPPTKAPPTAAPRPAPPAVSITALTPRVEPGQDIQIATNAVSDAGIVKLELYMSNRLVDTWNHDPASGPPARSVFQTLHFRRAREGQYDAWVRAFDATGQAGESVRERVRVRPAEQ